MTNAEKTNYPKIFEKSNWGVWKNDDVDESNTPEILNNRNNFVLNILNILGEDNPDLIRLIKTRYRWSMINFKQYNNEETYKHKKHPQIFQVVSVFHPYNESDSYYVDVAGGFVRIPPLCCLTATSYLKIHNSIRSYSDAPKKFIKLKKELVKLKKEFDKKLKGYIFDEPNFEERKQNE